MVIVGASLVSKYAFFFLVSKYDFMVCGVRFMVCSSQQKVQGLEFVVNNVGVL